MSSMRNAAPNRQHRERAQPHSRRRHGLLEKHKDYALRARDHNAKKERLRLLRQKARDRNPDEFAFAMMSSRTSSGGTRVAERRDDSGNIIKGMSHETVKLLKTQDKGYLRTVRESTRRERERLEEEVLFLDNGKGEGEARVKVLKDLVVDGNAHSSSGANHMVFVEDEQEQEDFSAGQRFETDAKTQTRPHRGSDGETLETPQDEDFDARVKKPLSRREKELQHQALKAQSLMRKQRVRTQEKLRKQLEAVKTRERELAVAEAALDKQRAQMSGNMGGVNKHGVKFKVRERKR